MVKAAPQQVAVTSAATQATAPAEPLKISTEVLGDSIAGAFDSLPGFESNSTIVAQKGITIEDTRKANGGDLKSLIQSIVSTIEPALSALGSQNHAAVSVVIRDTEDKTQVITSDPIAPQALQSSIVEAVTQAT